MGRIVPFTTIAVVLIAVGTYHSWLTGVGVVSPTLAAVMAALGVFMSIFCSLFIFAFFFTFSDFTGRDFAWNVVVYVATAVTAITAALTFAAFSAFGGMSRVVFVAFSAIPCAVLVGVAGVATLVFGADCTGVFFSPEHEESQRRWALGVYSIGVLTILCAFAVAVGSTAWSIGITAGGITALFVLRHPVPKSRHTQPPAALAERNGA